MKVNIEEVPDVCKYCRKIRKEPDYPEFLELYRGDMLCLTVDVEKASKLRLVENEKEGPLYRKYYESQQAKLSGLKVLGKTH